MHEPINSKAGPPERTRATGTERILMWILAAVFSAVLLGAFYLGVKRLS
jgi:hypothetical protein